MSEIINPLPESQQMATIKPKKVIIKKKTIQQPNINFNTMKEKGDAYEILIKHLLLDSGNYDKVHLWQDVPEADLFASGIMDDWNTARLRRKTARKEGLLGDIGTDLLVLGVDGKYSIIQCKYYDEDARLRIEDLGTFYFMMMNYHQMVGGIVYHTSKLSHLLELHREKNNLIQYKQHPFNPARYRELLDTIYKPVKTESNTKLIPFDYQLEAITALQGKLRTVCQLPCGCGKTLIAIKICEAYKQNVIITPLKSYCEQNLERFQSQMDSEYKMMIIDSDGDGRNIDKIQDFVKKNVKICLFVTFKSVDIINALVNDGLLKDCFMVIDEFHNISINDILEVEEDFEELQDSILEEAEPVSDVELDGDEELDEELVDEIEDNELVDDDEMDEEESDNTTEMYKLLHSNARILFMSATPRLYGDDIGYSEDCDIDEEIFGAIDYKMPMHEAITSGKICDYMVYVPTLSIEKTVGLDKMQDELDIRGYDKELVIKARFLLRGMMNNGSRRCIIYLQTKEECRKMNTILADVGKNYFGIEINSNYLISDLRKDERKLVLKEFIEKTGYNFLCSVDILNECIDIPECDSIFIAYPSKSKIRNIQRVCRANRKDKKNPDKVARIYVWADEYKDDLVDFISHLKEYDETFTFEKVRRVNVHGKQDAIMKPDDDSKENKKLEGLVVGVKGVDSWMEKLEEVKKFIDENGRRPTIKTNAKLSNWIQTQITNIQTNTRCISNKIVADKWKEFINDVKYKKYFDIDLIRDWKNRLNELKLFITMNNSLPTGKTNKSLQNWLRLQKYYAIKNCNLLKYVEINSLWKEFINDSVYKPYFDKNNIYEWKNKLELVKIFIDENNARPTTNTNLKLHSWVSVQVSNFKNKEEIMKLQVIYDLWYEFINNARYTKYFDLDNFRDWKNNLEKAKQFIDENNARPTEITNKYLDRWVQTQITNSKKRVKIMKNDVIYNLWNKFITDARYAKYFDLDNISDWKIKLEKLKEFINVNNKLPNDKTSIELKHWISYQKHNSKNRTHIMKNNEIYNLWNDFINHKKYSIYFIDKKEHWANRLDELKKFLIENNKRPTDKTNKELDNWLAVQLRNYEKREDILKEDDIYNLWINFMNDNEYKKYFISNEEKWMEFLDELKTFIKHNNHTPRRSNKELFNWFRVQKVNFKQKIKIMKDDKIYNLWKDFINSDEYGKYF